MTLSRRDFLKASGATLAVVATGAVLARVAQAAPATKRQYGMVIDLKKCIKCDACTVSCIAENHLPPGIAYNEVMEHEVGEYPNVRREFLPRPCMQCGNPPCVSVCPVEATWKREEDGIVVIDYDKCIGCRYCVTACPYGARYFDFGEYYHPADLGLASFDRHNSYDLAPSPEYNQRRVRQGWNSPIGNVRKCTFCLHRVQAGLKPACVESCLGHARYFGVLSDPNDPLWELISRTGHFRLKEELGTEPSVYYLQ